METSTVDSETYHPQFSPANDDNGSTHDHDDIYSCARCLIEAGLATDVTAFHITHSGQLIG